MEKIKMTKEYVYEEGVKMLLSIKGRHTILTVFKIVEEMISTYGEVLSTADWDKVKSKLIDYAVM